MTFHLLKLELELENMTFIPSVKMMSRASKLIFDGRRLKEGGGGVMYICMFVCMAPVSTLWWVYTCLIIYNRVIEE